MDLALHFPCVYPLIKQGFRRAKSSNLFLSELTESRQIADAPSPRFGKSLSKTGFIGDRRIWPQETSVGRSKKGSVCCKKPSQEEIISLLKRIQSSISKGRESLGGDEEKKNGDESSEIEPPLSRAILDVLEKPRKKTQGDTSVKKETPKLPRPQSSFAKRYIRPSASGSRGKLQDKALEEMTKEEESPLIELETMKLAELKEVAKNRGIKGYSKLKKSDLLNLLESS